MELPGWLVVQGLILALLCLHGAQGGRPSKKIRDMMANSDLMSTNDKTLLVSTLDGALHSISKSTGTVKWSLQTDPVVKGPAGFLNPKLSQMFPNPKDGSLYRYSMGQSPSEPLQKLPFSIPELVDNSPCRSSDGTFYLGKKVDSWIAVDTVTGRKKMEFDLDGFTETCPKLKGSTIYIGRSKFVIGMLDFHTAQAYNITYYEYLATAPVSLLKDYEMSHYTGAGKGTLVTVDKAEGQLLWNVDLGSPIASMFLLSQEGSLVSVPVTSVSPQTIDQLVAERAMHQALVPKERLLTENLNPTIYLGETQEGIYVVPALVDNQTAVIKEGVLPLIEGPDSTPQPNEDSSFPLILGFYMAKDKHDEIRQLDADEGLTIPTIMGHKNTSRPAQDLNRKASQFIKEGTQKLLEGDVAYFLSAEMRDGVRLLWQVAVTWLFDDPMHLLVSLIIVILPIVIAVQCIQEQRYKSLRDMSHNTSQGSRSGGRPLNREGRTAVPTENEDGSITVRHITFNPDNILGGGCGGTFVFRGTFDGRDVAVKRILPRCFSVAAREVKVLRESDQHPNVIRYFCMEQCREFVYIALELCEGTLQDYALRKMDCSLKPLVVLYQATAGVNHLHSLGVVHRDIKPQNILIAGRNKHGENRVLISDFGLCRQLEHGRMSFSESDISGTDGWIAPEMSGTARPSTKVDIFALGCVYYYILSRGSHPFGHFMGRQTNIFNGVYSLSELDDDRDALALSLLQRMIDKDPTSRPTGAALLKHPLFWKPQQILQYIMEVSDRIEKEPPMSTLLANLETESCRILDGNWWHRMHPLVQEDLSKARHYDSGSVRDLLRAIRNKKNHYRELSPEVQNVYGQIPHEYVRYWLTRFPLLLLHTWLAMQSCKIEPIFQPYYDQHFYFKHKSSTIQQHVPQTNKQSVDTWENIFDNVLGPKKKGPRRDPKAEDKNKQVKWTIKKSAPRLEPHYMRDPK